MLGLPLAVAHAEVSVLGTDKDALWEAGTMKVTAPADMADGDLMVIFLGASDTAPLTSLEGWKPILSKGPNDISLTSFYRIYRRGAAKTFRIPTHHASFATLVALRGADPEDPIVDKGAFKDKRGPKARSHAPGINSVAGGLLLCGFVWDDPYQNVSVPGMKVLVSYKNGDDGLTVAAERTGGGNTGERVAQAPAVVAGGGNEVGMAVTIRPKSPSSP